MLKKYMHILLQLLRADFVIMKDGLFDKLVNLAIYLFISLFVPVFLLPAFGISAEFASFSFAGAIATAGMFEVFPSVTNLVSDFEGDNITSYYLTLPIPSWLIFVRSIICFSLSGIMLSVYSLPVAYAVVFQKIDLSQLHVGKFLLIMIITNIFYGAFAIWVTSHVKNLLTIEHVWMRFVFPLWFLGGFQFTWVMLKQLSVWLAYIDLLNPMIYIMEGNRAAMLGQQNYISFWICISFIVACTALCSYNGIKRLKKRLDFV